MQELEKTFEDYRIKSKADKKKQIERYMAKIAQVEDAFKHFKDESLRGLVGKLNK